MAGRTWLNLRDEQGVEHIELATEEPIGDQRAIRAEYTALLVLAFIRWVADREVSPLEVSFEHAPRGPVEDYARALRCPVKFEAPHSEILFAKGTLDLPSAHANPTLAQAADAFAARLLAELPGGGTVAHTRRALAALLDSGEGDVRKVSRRLGMSARTLQRRLAEEGQSFRDVLDYAAPRARSGAPAPAPQLDRRGRAPHRLLRGERVRARRPALVRLHAARAARHAAARARRRER